MYFRNGFATNSSSSHHIICKKNNINTKIIEDKTDDFNNEYGWYNFTLSSEPAKLQYLIQQTYSRLYGLNETNIERIIFNIFGLTFQDYKYKYGQSIKNGYVDHQSVWAIPEVDIEFVMPYLVATIVDDPNIIITGGNDNDKGHPLEYDRDFFVIKNNYFENMDFYHRDGYVVGFNKNTGTKFRTRKLNGEKPEYSLFPELIDVSITNYCDNGCPYCYKDSNENGKHASLDYIENLFAFLNGKCLEIALGGGEPLRHPYIEKILQLAKNNNLVVNLSTKVKDLTIEEYLMLSKYCGAVAYSTQSIEDMKEFNNLIKSYARVERVWSPNKFGFHYIIGIDGNGTILSNGEAIVHLDSFLKNLPYDSNVVLLSYKQQGRAEQTPPQIFGWTNIVNNYLPGTRIAIDDMLASSDEANAAFSNITLSKDEGKFSAYIDAVNKTLHPSSHSNISYQLDNTYYFRKGWYSILGIDDEKSY